MDLKYIAFLFIMMALFFFVPADVRQFFIFFGVLAIFINQTIDSKKK